MTVDSRNSRQVDFTQASRKKKNLEEINLMVNKYPETHLWSLETILGLLRNKSCERLRAKCANISLKKRNWHYNFIICLSFVMYYSQI